MDLSREALAGAAGVDPWELVQRLRTSDPDALRAGALRLRRAGQLASEAADRGASADRTLGAGFRNDGFP